MKFYHIEIAKTLPIEVFTPRIPYRTMPSEDKNTQRICVSTTLEGCISAAPWGGLCLDTHPNGILYRVYVFDEDNIENIIEPRVLAYEYGVLDALVNDEYWLMETSVPIESFLIAIDNFYYDSATMINGEEHPIITNLKYTKIDEMDCGNILDVSLYANDKNFYEKVSRIIENCFMFSSEFIDDYMEDVHLKSDTLYINTEELFYKKMFFECLEDEEYMRKLMYSIA